MLGPCCSYYGCMNTGYSECKPQRRAHGLRRVVFDERIIKLLQSVPITLKVRIGWSLSVPPYYICNGSLRDYSHPLLLGTTYREMYRLLIGNID
jgi:hypothetical protein